METINKPISQVKGEYTVTHLRPKPECMEQFMPLWDARNAATAERDELIEVSIRSEVNLFTAGDQTLAKTYFSRLMEWFKVVGTGVNMSNPEVAEYQAVVVSINKLSAKIEQLTADMRQYQFEVGETETFPNLVTNVGKNDILDKYLKGATYTQTIVMGLKGVGTAVAADTQASHASWLEQGLANAPTYTGSRKAVTMGSAASQVSTSPTQAFAITSTGTVAGCFINNGGSATVDNTTGVLFSAGDFTGGNKSVVNLDTLNVIYTLTAT